MRRPLTMEHIQDALYSLKLTRTRTLLTILGVVIGVASITTILALSSGVWSVIGRQVDAIGGNIAVVRPSLPDSDANILTYPATQQAFRTSTLTESDYNSIAQIPGVKAAAPIMTINGSLKAGENNIQNASILATTPSFLETATAPIKEGQFIDSVTTNNTAVIGTQLSIDLFGSEMPLGQTFSLRGQEFTVIGILKKSNDPINYNNINLDKSVIISLESGKMLNHGFAQIQQINLRAKNGFSLPQIVKNVDDKITENHKGEKDYLVIYGKNIATPMSGLFLTIIKIMIAIAAISLLVGGVGIMNIMLVGVAERTREIGLRKAVGASNANIVAQFMAESLIVSVIGGFIGVVLGYIIAIIIGSIIQLVPLPRLDVFIIGLAISIIVGVVFGLYPAIRAARKDPIESLRQYH